VSTAASKPIPRNVRKALPADAGAIAAIYNEGIEDRSATFETAQRSAGEVAAWFDGTTTLIVVEDGKAIGAFARAMPYRSRPCYAGVREFSIYVAREARGKGFGRVALEALIEAEAALGSWKLLSRVFPENEASLALLATLGFREVGLYRRHAKLDGIWRDVVIVEKLIGEAA
jgi:L-amino acid N-acyltransferase YncA